MLLDIIPMPPICGITQDQTILMPLGDLFLNRPNSAPHLTYNERNRLIALGTRLRDVPQRLYKAIHISPSFSTLFETVFSLETYRCVCLYTKVIDPINSNIVVSLEGLRQYTDEPDYLTSLIDIVKGLWNFERRYTSMEDISSLVPIFTNTKQVQKAVQDLALYVDDYQHHDWLDYKYLSLYQDLPYVLEALLTGVFRQNPFDKQKYKIHGVQFPREEKWLYMQMRYHESVFKTHPNPHIPIFTDAMVNAIVQLPAKTTLTSRINYALNNMIDLGARRAMVNPYWHLQPKTSDDITRLQTLMMVTLRDMVFMYCEHFHISPNDFFYNPDDLSSVTIEKTIHDEILITFHDVTHDRFNTFYGYLPTMALTTKAVGYSSGE